MMVRTTTVAAVNPLVAAQTMLDLLAGLPVEAQGGTRAAVVALLTPLCEGDGRAAEVVRAAERVARPAGPTWLADLLADYRGRWAEAARAREVADTLYLADGGEVGVEQDEHDRFVLRVGNGASADPVSGWAELTGDEGLNLVRLLLAQPAVQNARRDAGADWEAGGRA